MVSVKDAARNATTYTYDPFGNLKTTTDALGNAVTATYHTRGRKIASNDPDLDALVRVRDHGLHAAEAVRSELAQEGGPERLGLGGTDVHTQHPAPAVGIDTDDDDHRDRDDAALGAHFHVGRVDPQVGPVAFERARS